MSKLTASKCFLLLIVSITIHTLPSYGRMLNEVITPPVQPDAPVLPIDPLPVSPPLESNNAILTFYMHDVHNVEISEKIIPLPEPNAQILVDDAKNNKGININDANISQNDHQDNLSDEENTTTTNTNANININNNNNSPSPVGTNTDLTSNNNLDDPLPVGPTLQNLMVGTTIEIDEDLTEEQKPGGAVVGKARGFYVASSEEEKSQTLVLTMTMEGGQENHEVDDSISFFGVRQLGPVESQVAVVGGTGKYKGAKGYGAIKKVEGGGDQGLVQLCVYLL